MTLTNGRIDAPCPVWCTGDHDASKNRRLTHRSNPAAVAAVERRGRLEDGPSIPVTVDLIVGLEQSHSELWVWLGPEDDASRGMAISFESAQRLSRALAQTLESAQQS
ncbi:hypothetical protein [Microbacterium sp. cx-59]|uniref:DUF6907 domain-containing protein n=1 Tax=Microbacterium sp. cx-59 TaxID=2891207 RepID=UPI001E4AFE29|nr:hypothetical protein [Microbacterium sp. cx-59]MCC4908087.1 hypothetical protein [Microbacterium sp. cx-59]